MSVETSNYEHSSSPTETALVVYDARDVALRTAIEVWAASSTGTGVRRRDELVVKKRKVVQSFFSQIGKEPGEVTPQGVQEWCEQMKSYIGRANDRARSKI